jgi:hypothetical protein
VESLRIAELCQDLNLVALECESDMARVGLRGGLAGSCLGCQLLRGAKMLHTVHVIKPLF